MRRVRIADHAQFSKSQPAAREWWFKMGMQKRLDGFVTVVAPTKKQKGDGVCRSGFHDEDQGVNPTASSCGVTKGVHADAVGGACSVEDMQQRRSLANKNHALAKQVVIRAEQEGDVPELKQLLVEESWRQVLGSEFEAGYFARLEEFVKKEWRSGQLVFPPKDCIFRAFNSCPLDAVRVVILGQDPYHDLGQAQGLSFSVPKGKALPSSLRNIYKEISQDVGCKMPKHGCLESWSHQGVLLLNAVLTVKAHSPASHSKRGWEEFTTHAVRMINKERSGVVFLLWGKYAQEKGRLIDTKRHHVLSCAHPSGLSAHRGFFGCRHFSKANELLLAQGQQPVDWCIPEL